MRYPLPSNDGRGPRPEHLRGWGLAMSHHKFCMRCGEEVRCAESRETIEGMSKTKLRLMCPNCERTLALLYDDERELLPVANARIVG